MRTDFESVIQSVRRISGKLLPEHAHHDLFSNSIELLCKSLERPGLGNIYFSTAGTELNLPDNSRMYLYRIVQELIHNAFKHSSAWHVWVRINWETSRLLIEVEDDGSGFNKISEFIERLRKKSNTLKLRSQAIGALISYHHGSKGLLAKVKYDF